MLKDVPFQIVYSTGENEPIEFFFDALLESKTFDLGLGFFSSTGINVLNVGFAYFIHKGGKMRIIINDVLSEKDKHAIEDGNNKSNHCIEDDIIGNIKKLAKTLSKNDEHFFKCLSFLISEKRIQFIATKPSNKKGGIAHNKYGIFADNSGNKVGFNGSANFSKNALLNNVESISCYKSWSVSESEIQRLSYFEEIFNKTWQGKSANVKIIPIYKVEGYIRDTFPVKDIHQLIEEEESLANSFKSDHIKRKIKELYTYPTDEEPIGKSKEPTQVYKNNPRFPFPDGPRKYQEKAYENWKENNFHGIFAMATGTGKTITSLNCVLKEYQKTNKYNVLILVPTLALVEQWETEIGKFNFKNYVLVSGSTKWQDELSSYKANYRWRNIEESVIIIATYPSFTNPKFLNLFKSFQRNFTVIADEAHNIGAPSIKAAFKQLTCEKRIALSATPKRIYDPEGTQELELFFKDKEPYCYSYSLEKAIDKGFLTPYYYYPHIVQLQENEMAEYIKISKRLLQFFDSETGTFKNAQDAEKLLLQRKRIIHKAINKLDVFAGIVKQLNDENKLKYCFTFAPEGDFYGDNSFEDFNNIIDRFIVEVLTACPNSKVNSYTSNDSPLERKDKLRGFSEGKIDMLFTMKAIDEGVDIPRAEIGIFTSSTGNPRQFIQRRGRLLRKHPEKKYATIHDLIVIPNSSGSEGRRYLKMETSLVAAELKRVAYFASLSENFYDSKNALEDVMKKYNLNLDTIIKELKV
ncbi:DEAD/DEAH box helicase family protein [uncultured Draconibacterium sp.]|uniref:DEAD/DEAH box helicase family protein n=1 Tax=uncultured Draconibacterium sp. TaxID=1573823 RepID=UPI0032172E91